MFFQVASSGEMYFAVTASVRRIVGVHMKVKLQIRKLVESLLAQAAAVGFLACVNQNMVA